MAISAATVWEVRTAGSDSNGGGFVAGASGTDFSQQNAAQYTFSDLASTNGTSGTPTVTSASHSFVAADVGNIIQITAGTNWTTGFYQITSVAGGGAVVDRAVGTAANLSGGTYAVGGALLTPAKAVSGAVTSNVIYMKAGTYTITTPIATTVTLLFIGYHNSRGDYDGTKPLITTATNSVDLVTQGGGSQQVLEIDNIDLSCTAGTPGNGTVAISAHNNQLMMRNSKLSGFANAINGDDVGAHFTYATVTLIGCEVTACTHAFALHTATVAWGGLNLFGCYIHGMSGDVCTTFNTISNGQGALYVNTIFDNNAGVGCSGAPGGGRIYAFNCNFTNNSSDGLQINDGGNSGVSVGLGTASLIVNCIFYGNGGIGLNVNASVGNEYILGRNNAFGNNTGGNFANLNAFAQALLISGVTLTANPFISSTNFSLNNTAGGGAACAGAGVPGPLGSVTTGTINIGAVQASGGAGSAGLLSHPGMSGGMFG